MRTLRSLGVISTLLVGLSGCDTADTELDMATLMASLELDPEVELDVECPPLPEGAERVLFAGVFANGPQVRPGEAGFPTDFCPPEAAFFARAEGRGNSTLLGEFLWSEQYCAGTPRGLVAEGHFEGANGDRLDWEAVISGIPPSSPDASMTFAGEFTFVGGSGPYANGSGSANVSAVQLGDATMDEPGSTAAALCGWIG